VADATPQDFADGAVDCWLSSAGQQVDQEDLSHRGWRKLKFVKDDKDVTDSREPTFTRIQQSGPLPTTVIDLPDFGQPLSVCRAVGHFETDEQIEQARSLLDQRLHAIDATITRKTADRSNQTVDNFATANRTASLFRFQSRKELHFLVDARPAEKK